MPIVPIITTFPRSCPRFPIEGLGLRKTSRQSRLWALASSTSELAPDVLWFRLGGWLFGGVGFEDLGLRI